MKLISLIFCFILTGCAMNGSPYITYSDKSHPLSDTAVFTTIDSSMMGSTLYPSISAIDGKPHGYKGPGSALWVRILPGKHEFEIIYTSDPQYTQNLASYKTTTVKVFAEMHPKHIYVAQPEVNQQGIIVTVKELPENSDYKMRLGLKGVNYQEFTAEF